MVVGKRQGGMSWKIGEEIMEEVEEFMYLGVWFGKKLVVSPLREDGKYGRRVGWKGDMDIQSEWTGGSCRGTMVWDLIMSPNEEYAAEVWWSGGRSVCRKLKLAQMRVTRRLLVANNTVAEVKLQGDLGWRKLEERKEEMKVLFGKRLKGVEESMTGEDGVGETKREWRVLGRV